MMYRRIPSKVNNRYFHFVQSKQRVYEAISSLVSSPDSTISSVAPIVKSCATALSPAKFSNILQKPNIEDHTALYWAIVNRREALLELIKFILKFSPVCSSDLRLACMAVNDHDSFVLLNLGENDNRKCRHIMS
jgi:hypothetical protein